MIRVRVKTLEYVYTCKNCNAKFVASFMQAFYVLKQSLIIQSGE